jgi:hypothetical protein
VRIGLHRDDPVAQLEIIVAVLAPMRAYVVDQSFVYGIASVVQRRLPGMQALL